MESKNFFSESAFYRWSATIFGKILLHTIFWILFFLYLTIEVWGEPNFDARKIVTDNVFYIITTMFGVYANAYYFVPYFLYQRKFLLYIASFISIVLFTGSFKLYFFNFVVNAHDTEPIGVIRTLLFWVFRDLFEILAISSIKLASDWVITAGKLNETEKNEIEAEFKFLKAQVNPHFIFNTLNNIYFLINKNSSKAGEAILSLSNLLRYRIYERNESESIVENEIQCIKELIELEKLRHDGSLKVELHVMGAYVHHKIEPLLFIPFVENAFKHCGEARGSKWIAIHFELEEHKVKFTCSNSKSLFYIPSNNVSSGIGIKNVKSRLQLLYPNNHTLEINDGEDLFTVGLTIRD